MSFCSPATLLILISQLEPKIRRVKAPAQNTSNETATGLGGLEPTARSITERAKQLMQGDLCTNMAFPDCNEAIQMAKICISEAVRWRLDDPTDDVVTGAHSLRLTMIDTHFNILLLTSLCRGQNSIKAGMW